MQSLDLHVVIAELSKVYAETNEHWSDDTCVTRAGQVYRQKWYRDAFKRLSAVDIEGVATKIIADSVSEKILNRLRRLIADNIRIYEVRKDEFDGVGFGKLYKLWEDYQFADKREHLLQDRKMIANYPYPTEQERKLLLPENQRDINQLDNERDILRRNDSLWIGKNYYAQIYDLSVVFAEILNNYFPCEKGIKPAVKQGAYFDMNLTAAIHNLCNNIQFENISETDLYAALNLLPSNAKVIVKSGERTRMCYLIHKLYEHLKSDNRAEWRAEMLKTLEIREDFYKSKYKEPVSEIPSRKSESFAQRINMIFG